MSISQQQRGVSDWDSKRLADFRSVRSPGFKRQDGTIFQQIAPDFRKLVTPKELLPKLLSRGLLTQDENQMMLSDTTPRMEKNMQLLQILQYKGTTALDQLYLSILESYESVLGYGLPGHYELAKLLRQLVRKQGGIDTEKEDTELKDPCSIVDKLPSVQIPEEVSANFTSNLGLSSENSALTDVQKICQCWLRLKGKECTMESLVEALLLTRGLGYLVSGMLPPSYCNPPEVYNFIRKLGSFTGHLAIYLGYSQEHINTIMTACRNVPENSWAHFLQKWQMPDCGAQCTSMILEQVVIRGKLQCQLTEGQQMVVSRFAAGNQLQGGNSEIMMRMQFIFNLQSSAQGASNLALPLKPGSVLPLKMIPSMSLNSPQQESEEMDGSNRSLPHVFEGSQSQKHLLKGDPQQEKHSQLLPEQISGPKQHSTTMPQTTELQRETPLPVTSLPLHERSQKVQEPARNQAGPDAYDLLDASRKNDWELVEGLAESGTSPDASSQDGKTPLMYACMQGQTKVVKRLVEKGASVSTADSGGKTPLMYACISGKLELVKLVGKEADVSARDHNGECCLHFPETLKNYKLVEYLVKVFTLLDRSLDIPSFMNKYTPLMVACTIGEDVAHTIKLLLESGVNPNGNSEALRQPLIEASANGCTKVVQELLKHEANPDIQDASGITALLEACQKKQLNMAILLIEHGVSLDLSDNDGTTPLFSAVTTNSFVLIQKLIQKGAKVNTTRVVTNPVMLGSVEETPLSHACARGFLDITKYLIQNNANVNYLCGGTVSPLGHAIILDHMHIVEHLLKNKDLDKSPYGLSTPIIIAVKMDKYDCSGWLLDELGGAEAALQRAQQNGMFELQEHIQIHLAATKTMLQPLPRGDVPVFQMPGNSHAMSIMQKFCSLCVEAAVNNADTPMPIENLLATVPTSRQSELSQFLYECINNKQNHETLIEDFLGGEYSAFKLLIQHNFLTMENFQIQACEKCEDPQQFCKELVDIIRQLPDGKRLPQDLQRVLQYVFSGNMTFGVTAGGRFNPSVGGAQMRQEDEHNPTAAWRQTSLPLKEKEQEQSPWKRSISASAHTGGWQFPGIGGNPVRQEHRHSLRHQTSLPFEGREQEQRPWKKSISDSGNTGGATSQTGATSSQRETDHHKLSEPSIVSADTETRQEIKKLRPFIKKEAVLLLDHVLGHGAYGSVIEVKIRDKIFAGKKLRADACTDSAKFWKKFCTEYQVLDKLRHNHIVEYHGLAIVSDHNSDTPILIMEKLMANLEEFITNPSEYGRQNPDFRLKLSFLIGIADGLSYLHSKGVIHRDLTARNILLNRSLVAKISDFGNSAIVDIEPSSHLQTKSSVPGTLLYMPPEACESPSRYNTKLDVFSFGHLSLFVITNQRMNNVLASTFRDESAPRGVGGRSEVERRQKYIDCLYEMIGQEHSLATLITSCLENFQEQRPSAIDVFTQLRKIYDVR